MADLILTLTIPEAVKAELINAFCFVYNYQPTILDGSGNPIPNPQTKGEFTKVQIKNIIKGVYRQYKIDKQKLITDASMQQAITQANTDTQGVTIT